MTFCAQASKSHRLLLTLTFLLAVSLGAAAQSCPTGTPTTPNLGLYVPAQASANWGFCINLNLTALDSYLSGGLALPALKVAGTTTLGNVSINGTCTGPGCASGGITSVTASTPLTSSGGSAPNISFTGVLGVTNGGTGTASPSLVGGSNITITGPWPNQTITGAVTGLSSLNGNTNPAQTITGTSPITVSSSAGTTTVACPTCGSGGGGTPGGANTQIQYNSSGTFAGSPDFTIASHTLTEGASGIADLSAGDALLPNGYGLVTGDVVNATDVNHVGDAGYSSTSVALTPNLIPQPISTGVMVVTAVGSPDSVGVSPATILSAPVIAFVLGTSLGMQNNAIMDQYVTGTGAVTAGNVVAFDSSSPSKVIRAPTGSNNAIGIALNSASVTATAYVATFFQASCVFENAFTAGDLVGVGTTVTGDCKDLATASLASVPSSTQVLGRVLITGASATAGPVFLFGAGSVGAQSSGGGGSGGPLWFGPRANLGLGQGAVTLGGQAGCSLVGSFTATAQPLFYGLPSSTTLRQTCKPQFTVNGTNGATATTVMYYADTMSFYYTANAPLTFRIKAFHPLATAGADVFSMTYTCTSATAEPPFSAAQAFPSVTVIGTAGGSQAGQNEEQVELTLTPGAGGLPVCNPNDTMQMSLSLASTTAGDNPVVMFFGGHP